MRGVGVRLIYCGGGVGGPEGSSTYCLRDISETNRKDQRVEQEPPCVAGGDTMGSLLGAR